MAERKATNKYYPPDWNPDKGSLNTYRGSHPLRERARKIKQGIIVVRFELPYNIWCNGCGSHVGMGVRYNAEKSRIGSYYTTPIFKFRMKCHLCDNFFEIHTDPKNSDYVCATGASRKDERWDHTEGETRSVASHSETQKRATDPMFQLEHTVEDDKKVTTDAPQVQQLQAMQQRTKDDFSINQMLRKRLREEKKEQHEKDEKDKVVQQRACISIPLVPESDDDTTAAKKIHYGGATPLNSRERRRKIRTQPALATSAAATSKLSPAAAKLSVNIQLKSGRLKGSPGCSSVSSLRTKLGVTRK